MSKHQQFKSKYDLNFINNNDYTLDDLKYNINHIYKNAYTYDFSNYTNINSEIIINCPIHGNFKMIALNHINGEECDICVISAINDFIEEIDINNIDKEIIYNL